MKKIILPIAIVLLIILGLVVIWSMGRQSHTFLIGSWHADPSVAAGYKERFVFGAEFESERYNYHPSEEDGQDSTTGEWSVMGDSLVLFEKGKLFPVFMKIGELETETDEAVVYKEKIKIGDNTYWRYTEETNLWNREGDLIIE